jgi:hypothetical protein
MRRNRQPLTQVLTMGCALFWIWVSVSTWAAAQDGQSAGTSALAFEPARVSVGQGGAASAKVTVALKSGKSGVTTLKAVDLPGGLAITFDPPSGDPTFTSTMRVKASPTTTPGTYTVKVQATGGDPSSAVSYSITVEKTSGY